MARRLAADAHDMHVIVHRILRGLFRRLEQRSHIDVKADIGKGGGDHLGAAVMPVLPHLDDQHPGATPLLGGESLDRGLNGRKPCITLIGRTIDTGQRFHLGAMAAENLFHAHADLSHGCTRAGGLDRRLQQIAALGGAALHLGQRGLTGGLVPRGTDTLQTRHLADPHGGVVDVQNVDRIFLVLAIFVDANDHLGAPVDPRLPRRRRLFDPQLGHSCRNSLGHAAHCLDLLDQGPGLLGKLMGQAFDIVTTRQRIDHVGDSGFLLQDQLRVARDPGGEFGGQGNRLVQRVGVQRLGAPQHGRHRLIGGADHVVIGILLLQTHAGGLAMGSQHRGLRVLRLELGHDAVPQQPCRAQLGRLHEEIHADRKEERQPPCELVHIHACRDGRAHIFAPVGQGIGQFLHQVRARLLHVIAGNRDRVELGHLVRGILDDVRNDPHRGFGRIDIGVADHELLEDVVLDRARQHRAVVSLLLARDDEIGQDRNDRAIHRHRHRHLVQRNAIKQDLHVLDTVDGDASLAHIAHHTRVIAVIAAMGGQIEGDRHPLLPRRKRLAIEGV